MMTQAEIDSLIDELVDAKSELDELRGQYDALVQRSFVVALDYNDVASALGCAAPYNHHEILARAKELAASVGVA